MFILCFLSTAISKSSTRRELSADASADCPISEFGWKRNVGDVLTKAVFGLEWTTGTNARQILRSGRTRGEAAAEQIHVVELGSRRSNWSWRRGGVGECFAVI